MARKAKALTRKITRARALSYDRMAPNARGVTALSEINGQGAYRRRYAQTRRMLKGDRSMRKGSWQAKMYQRQLRKGRSPAQARATVAMVGAHRGAAPRARRKPARRNSASKRSPMTANLRIKGQSVTKAAFVAGQLKSGRSNKQALATWRMLRKKQGFKTTKRKTRTFGKGRYTALKARAGTATKGTYLYRGRKGKTRHLPEHALLGYSSAAEMASVYRTGTEKQRASLAHRRERLLSRRDKAAQRAARKARAGTAWFSPNAGAEILSFEEWKMKRNAKKKRTARKGATPKGGTARAKFILAKMAKGATAKQAIAWWKKVGKPVGKKSAKKAAKKTTKRRKTTTRKVAGKKRTTTKRRTAKRRSSKRGFASMSKKKRCSIARKGGRKSAAKRYKGRKKVRKACAGYKNNRRRSYKRRAAAKPNRRRSYKRRAKATSSRRRSYRRSYRRNVAGAAFKMELMNAFKFGGIVLGGFLVHRGLSYLLDTYGLSKIGALQSGKGLEYRGLISDSIVAFIGVPAAVRIMPTHAGVAAAGVAASALYRLAIMVAKSLGQPTLAQAISAYPDAPGFPQYSGYGSYYQHSPHQLYGGGYAGMGAYGRCGASGCGDYYETVPTPGVQQAAAGVQQMYANQMGEYYAYGASAIGEYESVPYASDADGVYIDEGIYPNDSSAEQALDVAEAAAGIGSDGPMLAQAAAGMGDLPLQSTVDPMIRAMDIPDAPGGSRAGILAGSIFG